MENNKCRWGCGEVEALYMACENVKCSFCDKNSVAVPQKAKHRVSFDTEIPLLSVWPKELKARDGTDTCATCSL